MTIPAVVGSLAGQIPVITMAGITLAYKKAMPPDSKQKSVIQRRSKARKKRGLAGGFGTSPF